jgi:hypothetical protein
MTADVARDGNEAAIVARGKDQDAVPAQMRESILW